MVMGVVRESGLALIKVQPSNPDHTSGDGPIKGGGDVHVWRSPRIFPACMHGLSSWWY